MKVIGSVAMLEFKAAGCNAQVGDWLDIMIAAVCTGEPKIVSTKSSRVQYILTLCSVSSTNDLP